MLQEEGWIVKNIDYSKSTYLGKLLKMVSLILDPTLNTIHVHGQDFKSIFALIFRPYTSTIKLTDHSGRWIAELKGLNKLLIILFLRKIDKLILVGEHLRNLYKSNGIQILKEKIIIENAFIAPPQKEESLIWDTYTETTKNFVKSHHPLIVANAFQIVFFEETDLYGLDMCIELTIKLKKKYPNIGFLFALANDKENKAYLKQMKEIIKKSAVEENFLFMTGQKELWPLFKKADLMIRPTSNDGYGISIAEALHFGCPAIASDVCQRPEKTILFENRSIHDLYEKTIEVLK